jgi:hypothetical protein
VIVIFENISYSFAEFEFLFEANCFSNKKYSKIVTMAKLGFENVRMLGILTSLLITIPQSLTDRLLPNEFIKIFQGCTFQFLSIPQRFSKLNPMYWETTKNSPVLVENLNVSFTETARDDYDPLFTEMRQRTFWRRFFNCDVLILDVDVIFENLKVLKERYMIETINI